MENKCYFCGKDAVGEFLKGKAQYSKVHMCEKCANKNLIGYSNLIFILVREGNRSEAIATQALKKNIETFFRGKYMTIPQFYNELKPNQLREIDTMEFTVTNEIKIWAEAAATILEHENTSN